MGCRAGSEDGVEDGRDGGGDRGQGSVGQSGRGNLVAACSALLGLSLAGISRFGTPNMDSPVTTSSPASPSAKAFSATEQLEASLANGRPTMLEFYADWCSVCRGMQGTVAALRNREVGQINVVQINVENRAFTQEVQQVRLAKRRND